MSKPPTSVRTFWDGEPDGRAIPFGSSSVQHGTAVFEGIRGYAGPDGPGLFRLTDHVTRLLDSARLIGIGHDYDADRLHRFVLAAAAATGLPDCYVRPGLFARDPFLSIDLGRLPFTLGVEVWPMPPVRVAPAPVRLTVSSWRRPAPSSFPPRAKAVGTYVTSALAKAAAVAAGYDDAVQLDPDSGRVAEATTANIVLVTDGVVRTPWLQDSLLAGITRDTVLTLARGLGIPVEEGPVAVGDLLAADEVFTTGTASELTPVGSVDGRDYRQDRPLFDAIMAAFRDLVETRRHSWLTPVPAMIPSMADPMSSR
jgi:branched-chain amino acid aminotransferase